MGRIENLNSAPDLTMQHQVAALSDDERAALRSSAEKFGFEAAIMAFGPSEPVPIRIGDNSPKTPVCLLVRKHSGKSQAQLLAAANEFNWHDVVLYGQRLFVTKDDARLVLARALVDLEWKGLPIKYSRPKARGAETPPLWTDINPGAALAVVDEAAKSEGITAYTRAAADAFIEEAVRSELRRRGHS